MGGITFSVNSLLSKRQRRGPPFKHALKDKPLGITTEIYTHVAIRKVKTRARENASTGLKVLTLIDRYVPMRMLVP
jgi:hypothetical protein